MADPAGGLLRAVEGAGEEDFGDISAFYLKKSQAEEEREKARGAATAQKGAAAGKGGAE